VKKEKIAKRNLSGSESEERKKASSLKRSASPILRDVNEREDSCALLTIGNNKPLREEWVHFIKRICLEALPFLTQVDHPFFSFAFLPPFFRVVYSKVTDRRK